MSRILFIVRDSHYFLTHRLALALMLKHEGHIVRVLCTRADGTSWKRLIESGLEMREVPFTAVANHPGTAAACLFRTLRQFFEFRPQSVFTVTVLATILGGLCCRLTNTRHVALIAGLGSLFHTQTTKMRALRPFAGLIFRAALKKRNTTVIFQNTSDREVFLGKNICEPHQTEIIPGSGVNPNLFSYQPYRGQPSQIRRVGLVARMLKDKGVMEFIQAAESILAKRRDVEFILVGGTDEGNPTSFQQKDLERLTRRDGIKWLGHREDIAAVLASFDVFCLPSYHEGLPKALLEAASVGCALIVSDIPGCTAFVEHGINGLTVPKQNAEALAESIQFLLDSPEKAQEFSCEARRKIEAKFADNVILSSYRQLFSH